MQIELVERYLSRTFLPALGIPGRSFTVAPPAGIGTRSQVLVVRADGIGPVLLRPWRSWGSARRCVVALRHLDRAGIPAPQLIFHDLSIAGRWLRRLTGGPPYVTVESFIEGTRLSDLPTGLRRDDAYVGAAMLLRRYRQVTRSRWGRPDRPALRSYASHVASAASVMLRRLKRAGWIDAAGAKAIGETLGAWRPELERFRQYSLVHKDIHTDNLILTPEGPVVAVDLHRLAYEPFCEDLLNAVRHLFPDQPYASARFLDLYFGDGGEFERERFEATRGFFEPFYALKRLVRLIGRDTGDPGYAERPTWTAALLAARRPGPPG